MATSPSPRFLRPVAPTALASLCLCLFLPLFPSGCSDQGPRDELLQHVRDARTRWNAARLPRYAYGLVRVCECTPEMAGPVRVLVEGLEPVLWHYPDGTEVGASLRPSFPSVDGLLDMIEDAVRRGAWDVTVQYDAATGVPVQFRLDHEQFVFDEEDAYRVVEMPRIPDS